nr:minor core protein [Homalodisca vitripennis reovirus]
MSAIVGVCLLSETTVLVRNLNDVVKGLYSRIRGNVTPPKESIEARVSGQTVKVQRTIPINTVFIEYLDQDYISANPTMSAMEIIGSSGNTAPKTTFQSLLPSLSALFGVAFIQGAFMHRVISATGPTISFLVLVIGPPGNFTRKPSVAAASSVVQVESTSDIDLNDTVKINALMLQNTKLVSASAIHATSLGEVSEKCDSLDTMIIMKALTYFKRYAYEQSLGTMDNATRVYLNLPIDEIFSGRTASGEQLQNKIATFKESRGHLAGVVLPDGHGKSTLVSDYPEIFTLLKDNNEATDPSDNGEIEANKSKGKYEGKIVLASSVKELFDNGIRVLGVLKLESEAQVEDEINKDQVLKNKKDKIMEGWKNTSGPNVVTSKNLPLLHDKVMDIVTTHTKGIKTNRSGKPIEIKTDPKLRPETRISIYFKNGFPIARYSTNKLSKHGIDVVEAKDLNEDTIIVSNKPKNTPRRVPQNVKTKLESMRSNLKVDVDTDNLTEEEFIAKIKAL